MFINEYASKDNVKKYKVDEMWAGMRPMPKKVQDIDPDFPYSWTVDKTNETFFIPARTGTEEYGNQQWCIFWWKNTRFTVVLRKYGYFPKVDGKLGCRWELEKFLKPQGYEFDVNDLLPVLENALKAYGYDGVRRQYDNYIVEFNSQGRYEIANYSN
jgi:hypothetical protein